MILLLKLILVVPFSSLVCVSLANKFPDDLSLFDWSSKLETKLTDLFNEVTQLESVRDAYHSDVHAKLHKINGTRILENVLDKMSTLMKRKKEGLKRLVRKAEETVTFRKQFAPSLTNEEVPFFNMKTPPRNANLTYNSRFKQRVSLQESGVHIPLEIFDGYPKVLHLVNWSTSLDEVFKNNYAQDPTISWQYFGSSRGVMRVYPAFRWPDNPNLPDLFDVRRRSWFIHASVSPKDVIILMDRSGSVHGQTIDIIKVTVKALLNTLGENDYVNVAWFNNQVEWVVPCLDTLVQATAQNRRLLSDAVHSLTESNYTSYAAALNFAFEAFEKFNQSKRPWEGSNCNRVIMFLSDGSTEWPSELVKKHCNETRDGQIRIFTFACGPHPIPQVVLKEMACATGGYFSPITALGSVRIKISDYIRVLSRPLARAGDDDIFEWHNFYRDVGGLGMITTVTLPVYNRWSSAANPELLGVMGIDVPVDEMVVLYPKHDLGLFGYGFSLNTNGFVVFHPRLRDHIFYIEDPPDVDFTEVEGQTDDIEAIRKKIINGEFGSTRKVTSIVPVGSGFAIPIEMDYFYGSTEQSTFRFGVAVPSDGQVLRVHLNDLHEAVVQLERTKGALLAPWKYCDDDMEDSLNIVELVERILSNQYKCNTNLVNHLLWDTTNLQHLRAIWDQSKRSDILSRFVVTMGGLTLVDPSNLSDDVFRQKDPLMNNLYKRAARRSGYVFSISKGRPEEVAVASRVLYQGSYVAAVVGTEVERRLIQNIFYNVTSSAIDDVSCEESESIHCFLLNEGGSIIASNQASIKAGEFIGMVDPQILAILLEGKVLQREDRYNFQSWCSNDPTEEPVVTLGAPYHSSIISVIYELVFSLNWMNYISLITHFILSFFTRSSEGIVIVSIPKSYHNHSCVTRSSWYYYAGTESYTGAFECYSPTNDTCSRSVRVVLLPRLTLTFVVAQRDCECVDRLQPQSLNAEEDPGPNHCQINQKYRKGPTKCYAEKENVTDCTPNSGAASNIIVSAANTLLIILLIKVT